MECKNCGGVLVARHSLDFPINERGEYTEDYTDTPADVRVVCLECGARHAYEVVRDTSQPPIIIALEYNSNPDPVATVALALEGGDIVSITSDALVGLVIDDRDLKEVGGFLAQRNNAAWAAVMRLQSLIQRGEYRASYAEEESDG